MSTCSLMEKLLAGGFVSGTISLTLIFVAAAQEKPSPPDFSSNQVGWQTAGGDFIAVPGQPKPTSNDPAHPRVSNAEAARTGKQPSYRISDLTNPNFKPWVVERMRQDNAEVLAGKMAYTARSSCMPAGVPAFMGYPLAPIYFLQTPKKVVMVFSGDQQVRHVYLDVPHSAKPKPTWYGDSIGHYEGDTLVVDTIGLNDKTFVDSYRTPHTEKLHVVERWKLIEGGKRLEVTVRVDDPDTFHQPWSGIIRYDRVQQQMMEEVCAENNQLMFDYGLPVAKTPDF